MINGSAKSASDHRAEDAGLAIRMRPVEAFAAGALVVSALALAVSVGRHFPLNVAPNGTSAAANLPALDEVRSQTALDYEQLAVDRGTAQ